MTEYQILDLLVNAAANQTVIVGQIIGLHLAMVVGIYYFLHRSGWVMKLVVFILYTLGYATFISIISNHSAFTLAGTETLRELARSQEGISPLSQEIMRQADTLSLNITSLLFTASLFVLWVGTCCFLFLWKRPEGLKDPA